MLGVVGFGIKFTCVLENRFEMSKSVGGNFENLREQINAVCYYKVFNFKKVLKR